jgi:hypothetical protein
MDIFEEILVKIYSTIIAGLRNTEARIQKGQEPGKAKIKIGLEEIKFLESQAGTKHRQVRNGEAAEENTILLQD